MLYLCLCMFLLYIFFFFIGECGQTLNAIERLCWCNVDSRFLHNKPSPVPEWALTRRLSTQNVSRAVWTACVYWIHTHFESHSLRSFAQFTHKQTIDKKSAFHWQWDLFNLTSHYRWLWLIHRFKAPTVSVYNQSSESTVQNKSSGIR